MPERFTPTQTVDGGGDEAAEPVPHRGRIVKALWGLNSVRLALKGVGPRVRRAPSSLDELERLIASTTKRSTADVLERELRAALGQLSEVAGALDAQVKRLRELLSRLDARQADLDED